MGSPHSKFKYSGRCRGDAKAWALHRRLFADIPPGSSWIAASHAGGAH